MAKQTLLKTNEAGRFYRYNIELMRWFPIKAQDALVELATESAIMAEPSFVKLTSSKNRVY